MSHRLFLYDSGIYQIKNLVNDKVYIGQTINLFERKHGHFSCLRRGVHHNSHLQNSWNKYGERNFKFEPIIYCDVDRLDIFEQIILDEIKPEYNIRKEANSNRGHKVSDITKQKISKALKGKKFSDDRKKRLSESLKGRTMPKSYCEKTSKRMMGHKINLGRKLSNEHKRKIGESNKGKKKGWNPSYETRKRMSLSNIAKGEKNGNHILFEKDVLEIREHHRNRTMKLREMSEKYGVSITTINNICQYKVWRTIS